MRAKANAKTLFAFETHHLVQTDSQSQLQSQTTRTETESISAPKAEEKKKSNVGRVNE